MALNDTVYTLRECGAGTDGRTLMPYNDVGASTRRAINPTTTKGNGMRLDLSSVAYTLIFAGIAVWATSKLIRA